MHGMSEQVKIEAESRTTSKGQTTIPKLVRDAMGITDGTSLKWTFDRGVLQVRAKTKRIEDFAGILGPPPSGVGLTVEEMDEAIAEAVAERFQRKTGR